MAAGGPAGAGLGDEAAGLARALEQWAVDRGVVLEDVVARTEAAIVGLVRAATAASLRRPEGG